MTERDKLIQDLTDVYIDLVRDKESALNCVVGESGKVDVSKLAVDQLKRNVATNIDSILRRNNF